MGKTVAELLNTISARELTYWIAYYSLEPFGEERADLRAAIIAATIANVNRKKGTRAYKPKDFMPEFFKEKKVKQRKPGMQTLLDKLAQLKRVLRR